MNKYENEREYFMSIGEAVSRLPITPVILEKYYYLSRGFEVALDDAARENGPPNGHESFEDALNDWVHRYRDGEHPVMSFRNDPRKTRLVSLGYLLGLRRLMVYD